MNHIYRSIWNDKTGTFAAASETAKAAGKKTTGRTNTGGSALVLYLKVTSVAVMLAFGANTTAQPVGGVVVNGGATIQNSAGNTTINQSTQNAVINWQSFNIPAGQSVQFVQPNTSSVALNRVVGSDPSSILGTLSANGKVFLVNPNGILFAKGASVNVGGLVASTLNITDSDFMAGNYRFSGNSSGTVQNDGSITANGGYVAMLGANVSNQGVIAANLGTVALAAGEAITLDVAGDGLLNVTVNKGAVNALIENGGLIQANGGKVLLTASVAGDLLKTVVNNTGVIEAQTLGNRSGTILLLADMQSGTVNVGGKLDASAPNGGDGGFIETSAAHVKIASDAKITTAAAQGQTGTWLIDPVDYTIAATGGDITGAQLSANLATNNVTILSSSGAVGVNGNINVADTVNWSANKLTLNAQNNININTAMTGTGTASLSLLYGQATAGGGTSTYNVLAPVSLPAGPNFTTQLGSNGVPVNYTVITALGAASGSVTATDLQGMNGNLNGNYALGKNIDASATAGWGGGGFLPVGVDAAGQYFTGNFDGLGHTITGLTIARATNVGLFGYVVSAPGATLRNVSFAGGIVSGADYVGTLAGHMTGGDVINSSSSSTQAVVGSNNYIGGLVGWMDQGDIINSFTTGAVSGANYVGGVVGWLTGNIVCCYATGPVTASGGYTGGLAGWVAGDITRSYATGNVNAQALYVGGLVGWHTGATTDSYANGSVVSAGGNVGGLVGWNDGIISNTYASGFVSGAAPVGGLVGFMNGGSVTNSFWDLETSNQPLAGAGVVSGAKGMPTLEMKKQVNFTSATLANSPLSPTWDFTNIWTMVLDGTTYPSLQACLAPATWSTVPGGTTPPGGVTPPGLATPPVVVTPDVVAPVIAPFFLSSYTPPVIPLTVVQADLPSVTVVEEAPVAPIEEVAPVPPPVETPYVAPKRAPRQDRG